MPQLLLDDLEHVLAHTGPIWPELAGARIFITCGTGFVGKWLRETLMAAYACHGLGVTAMVLTRSADRFCGSFPSLAAWPGLSLVEGDVRDFVFPKNACSHVIHAATDMTNLADPLHTYEVIVEGTKRVLAFAADRAVSRFMLISSGAIYGKQPPELSHLVEDFTGAPPTTSPRDAYGQGKRIAEWLTSIQADQYCMDCTIARLFAVTGPYLPLDSGYAVGNFVQNILAKQSIRILGDGTTMRAYLYAADMAAWLWTILLSGERGTAYNVGSERAVSIGHLAERVAALGGTDASVTYGQAPVPGHTPDRYVPATGRARNALSLQERIELDEGLRRMIAWHRSELY